MAIWHYNDHNKIISPLATWLLSSIFSLRKLVFTTSSFFSWLGSWTVTTQYHTGFFAWRPLCVTVFCSVLISAVVFWSFSTCWSLTFLLCTLFLLLPCPIQALESFIWSLHRDSLCQNTLISSEFSISFALITALTNCTTKGPLKDQSNQKRGCVYSITKSPPWFYCYKCTKKFEILN